MARHDFRQLGLADSIVRRRGKKSEWLDRLDAALDWPALETIVEGIYAGREGGLAYPLLTYVKLLLLQQWYGLSDEGLEAAVDDRLSFRRFAGIPLSESVPDHSSVWRFREELARRGLAERLLAEVDRQLDAKGLILRRGTLIDATILEAAVRPPGGRTAASRIVASISVPRRWMSPLASSCRLTSANKRAARPRLASCSLKRQTELWSGTLSAEGMPAKRRNESRSSIAVSRPSSDSPYHCCRSSSLTYVGSG